MTSFTLFPPRGSSTSRTWLAFMWIGILLELVADLLALDQQELIGHGDLGRDFVEPPQANFEPPFRLAFFDPLGKLRLQLVERLAATLRLLDIDPALGRRQHVVVGEDEEVVVMIAIPHRDRLQVVVAVAPMGMRMHVPAVPLEFTGRLEVIGDGRRGDEKRRASEEESPRHDRTLVRSV